MRFKKSNRNNLSNNIAKNRSPKWKKSQREANHRFRDGIWRNSEVSGLNSEVSGWNLEEFRGLG